jgi:hypothetical protein
LAAHVVKGFASRWPHEPFSPRPTIHQGYSASRSGLRTAMLNALDQADRFVGLGQQQRATI